jgi:hypothetical protein
MKFLNSTIFIYKTGKRRCRKIFRYSGIFVQKEFRKTGKIPLLRNFRLMPVLWFLMKRIDRRVQRGYLIKA